jgi:transcriptional regulator GlxA family with amidase domain
MDNFDRRPRSLAFVLLPGFSLVTLGCAIEPFRMTNERSGRTHFIYRTLGVRQREVSANDGLKIIADGVIGGDERWDIIFIVSSLSAVGFRDAKLASWLRRMARAGVTLGPLGAATVLAARLGLLDDFKCVTHWRLYSEFLEEFPRVKLGRGVYSMDRTRLTSAGGFATMDLGLRVIADIVEPRLAAEVAEIAMVSRIRPASENQRMSVHWRYGINDERVIHAIELMESNLENPLDLPAIAAAAGISLRQLERLFAKCLAKHPLRHYLEIRLQRAHQLVVETDDSVEIIALKCGFSDAPHLCRQFKTHFGISPSAARADALNRRRPPKSSK